MLLKIQISKNYDLDLMILCCGKVCNFSQLIYNALKSYAQGQIDEVCVPIPQTSIDIPSKKEIRLILDDNYDSEIIEMFGQIRPRQRNSFVKNLVRKSVNSDLLNLYFIDGCETVFHNTINIKSVTKSPNKPKKEYQSKNSDVDSSKKMSDKDSAITPVPQDNKETISTQDQDDFDMFSCFDKMMNEF